jgi:hypothetical protein
MTKQSIAGFTGKDHPVDVTDQILGALLFPTEGAKMATLLAKDAVKTVAQIWLAPGGGLPKHLRRLAIGGHDVVQVMVRGEVYRYGQVAPSPYDFHPSTSRWALKHFAADCGVERALPRVRRGHRQVDLRRGARGIPLLYDCRNRAGACR